MKKWLVILTGSAMLGLVGCGGGDSGGTAVVAGEVPVEATPVFSTLDFPVRAAYDAMMDPAQPIGLNLAGSDNAAIEPTTTTTVTQVDWPAWSKFPPPPPEVTVTTIPANLRWTGTITAQRRVPESPVTTPLGVATIAVDYNISLKRLRDGREYRDALTVFFDSDSNYLPLAAVTMQSRLWTWATPLNSLPFSGKIGVSSGTAIATSCEYPDVASLTELGCSLGNPTRSEPIPSIWSLQPDTAQTGFITFAYRAPFFDALDGGSSEAIVEIKTKIDGAGAFKGVEYVRIEGPLTIRLRG